MSIKSKILNLFTNKDKFIETGVTDYISFKQARFEAAAHGKLIAREGWKQKFVFVTPARYIKMNNFDEVNLPADLKYYFTGASLDISIESYLSIKEADNSINHWSPSHEDIYAKDWYVVKLIKWQI